MIPICLCGVFIVKLFFILFNTFVLLWITSFIDKGVIKDEDEAKLIIQNVNIIVVIGALLFFRVAGWIADKYPAYIVIPCSFLFRALTISAFF